MCRNFSNRQLCPIDHYPVNYPFKGELISIA